MSWVSDFHSFKLPFLSQGQRVQYLRIVSNGRDILSVGGSLMSRHQLGQTQILWRYTNLVSVWCSPITPDTSLPLSPPHPMSKWVSVPKFPPIYYKNIRARALSNSTISKETNLSSKYFQKVPKRTRIWEQLTSYK